MCDTRKLRQQLVAMKEKKEQELKLLLRQLKAMSGRVAEEAERSKQETDRGVAQGLVDNVRVSLKKLNEAIEAVDVGRGGVCIACKEPIPAERLGAVPFARRCAPCQDIHEHANMQQSGSPYGAQFAH